MVRYSTSSVVKVSESDAPPPAAAKAPSPKNWRLDIFFNAWILSFTQSSLRRGRGPIAADYMSPTPAANPPVEIIGSGMPRLKRPKSRAMPGSFAAPLSNRLTERRVAHLMIKKGVEVRRGLGVTHFLGHGNQPPTKAARCQDAALPSPAPPNGELIQVRPFRKILRAHGEPFGLESRIGSFFADGPPRREPKHLQSPDRKRQRGAGHYLSVLKRSLKNP